MRLTSRAALIAAAAIPLATAAPAAASAASAGDVTYSFAVDGSTVINTITNNSGTELSCATVLAEAPGVSSHQSLTSCSAPSPGRPEALPRPESPHKHSPTSPLAPTSYSRLADATRTIGPCGCRVSRDRGIPHPFPNPSLHRPARINRHLHPRRLTARIATGAAPQRSAV